MSHPLIIDGHHIPTPVKEFDYWVLWDFEVKQPRSPWLNGHCYPSEWRQDSDVNPRTNFDQASAAAGLGSSLLHDHYPFPEGDVPERVGPTLLLPHEGRDTPGPNPADPPLLFIDYDDVIDKSEQTISTEVWEIAKQIGGPLFVSRSFKDDTKSTAGLHQVARGTLPGQLTTINTEFETSGHIEVYYRSRMTGFTWSHVRGTPTETLPDATEALESLISEYGDTQTKRRASAIANSSHSEPPTEIGTPFEELDGETTDDIEDVFRAIAETTANEIRLRSTETETTDTRKSYDPSWETSDSGTRLGYDTIDGSETWIYRKANHPVDALQVVAREEGIITDITDYPEGNEFWQAVQSLRSRGSNIPYYEGNDGNHPDVLQLYTEPEETDDQRRQVLRAIRASKRS